MTGWYVVLIFSGTAYAFAFTLAMVRRSLAVMAPLSLLAMIMGVAVTHIVTVCE